MRVVTANVQHGVPDPVGRPALGRAVRPLRQLDASIYAFQELDRRRWRTRFQDQGAYLAEALGGELVWAPAQRRGWGVQANALVVRGRVAAQASLTLPGAGERRVAVIASVELDGDPWSVATTHLSLDVRTAIRQLEATLDALAELPRPRVLLGDLNLRPERLTQMAAATGWDLMEGPHTINARTGLNRRLDHVLTQGCTVTDSGVQKLPVSDHLAVWADITAP